MHFNKPSASAKPFAVAKSSSPGASAPKPSAAAAGSTGAGGNAHNQQVAAGVFKMLTGRDTSTPPTGGSAGGNSGSLAVLGALGSPGLLAALQKEEKGQMETNRKLQDVMKVFVAKDAQTFLRWLSNQTEAEKVTKFEFARSQCQMVDPSLAPVLPFICPELKDLRFMASAPEAFEALYWSVMGEALQILLLSDGSPVPPETPFPDFPSGDAVVGASAKHYEARMSELQKTLLPATKKHDAADIDLLVRDKDYSRWGDAVVALLEALLRSNGCPDEFLYRRVRRQILFRFFVLLLSFFLNDRDRKK
jgi:hypothetical protein